MQIVRSILTLRTSGKSRYGRFMLVPLRNLLFALTLLALFGASLVMAGDHRAAEQFAVQIECGAEAMTVERGHIHDCEEAANKKCSDEICCGSTCQAVVAFPLAITPPRGEGLSYSESDQQAFVRAAAPMDRPPRLTV